MVVTLVDSLHLQWASLHQRKGYVEFTPEDAKIAASTTCILNRTLISSSDTINSISPGIRDLQVQIECTSAAIQTEMCKSMGRGINLTLWEVLADLDTKLVDETRVVSHKHCSHQYGLWDNLYKTMDQSDPEYPIKIHGTVPLAGQPGLNNLDISRQYDMDTTSNDRALHWVAYK